MNFSSLFSKYFQLLEWEKEIDIEKLYEFYKMYKINNKKLNFSRLENLETIIRKHFIDSLMVSKILNENYINFQEPVMDLGTGGGFPGIPLAILHPKIKWILVESRKNRVEYLKNVKESLELRNVEIIHKTLNSHHEIICNSVITRAFERMKNTSIRTSNSLEKNGLLIFMKGPNCVEEIEELNEKDYKKILEFDYLLPSLQKNQKDYRKLVVFEKLVNRKQLSQLEKFYFNLSNKEKIKVIESSENSTFKKLKKILNSSKEIKKENLTIVAGEKIVKEFIKKYSEQIRYFIYTKHLNEKELIGYINLLPSEKIEWIYLSGNLREELEIKDYPPPYLGVEVPKIKSISKEEKIEKAIILPVKDPVNLGACIRSLYAFGIRDVILTKESCHPFLLKAIRSSSGHVFDCHFYQIDDAVDFILKQNRKTYILSLNGKNIKEIIPEKEYYLYVGEEGKGVPKKLEEENNELIEKIKIPMKNPIDSLNLSVSCGIALFYLEILI